MPAIEANDCIVQPCARIDVIALFQGVINNFNPAKLLLLIYS